MAELAKGVKRVARDDPNGFWVNRVALEALLRGLGTRQREYVVIVPHLEFNAWTHDGAQEAEPTEMALGLASLEREVRKLRAMCAKLRRGRRAQRRVVRGPAPDRDRDDGSGDGDRVAPVERGPPGRGPGSPHAEDALGGGAGHAREPEGQALRYGPVRLQGWGSGRLDVPRAGLAAPYGGDRREHVPDPHRAEGAPGSGEARVQEPEGHPSGSGDALVARAGDHAGDGEEPGDVHEREHEMDSSDDDDASNLHEMVTLDRAFRAWSQR